MIRSQVTAVFKPDREFTRHSEGAFLRLKDGGIFFAYSRFVSSASDEAPSSIVGCISRDEGKTWTEPAVLVQPQDLDAMNVMSVSLLRMGNGDLGLFCIAKRSTALCEIILLRSQDEGKTFYRHVNCLDTLIQGYYVLNNDRVIRLKSGRIILPLAYHRSNGMMGDGARTDSRALSVWVYSDDDGEAWREADDIVYPPFVHSRSGLQEPGVIEKENGVLWAYYRTDQLAQYEAFSMDAGRRWTVAQQSAFASPNSPLKLARHPSGRLYAMWNPIPNYPGREKSAAGWGRTPLALAFSDDDGASWSAPEVIEAEEGHGYCYPAMFFTEDNRLLTAYCSGGAAEGNCLARLTIRRIELTD